MTQNAPVHQLLRDVLCPSPERTAVAALVHRCHRMALAYLRVKERSGSLSAARSGIAVEDMAFDAIADLFRRTPRGSSIELQSYFRRADPSGTLTENEIQEMIGVLSDLLRDGDARHGALPLMVVSAKHDECNERIEREDNR